SVTHPYYWKKTADHWQQWTLDGWQTLDLDELVMHLTFFEADAFATFRGKRLPTEGEWELAARVAALREMDFQWGRVWEWTESAYRPYPGFCPAAGAVGEYNGKFMMDQMVLRGACDLTPVQHSRITYRNFYPAASAWQMSGFRLAEDA
ncbi:MAG: SUMF1/EgtB/PvdO family nonheme iron enzyme, partial [Leptospiraceae bacterium]|nr:SUMF1/EgtB/PvdO family nonheme iron enzyme [Leptospiraceae bacterium]